MENNLFGLNGDDYWEAPWKNSAALHEKYIVGGEWGLFIDAPSSVNPAVKSSLPIPFLYVAELREAYNIDLPKMAKVVAIRLEDRKFRIENAITPADKIRPHPKVGKDSSDPTSEKNTIDLQTQMGLLAHPGKYRVVVLLQQRMSNIVETVVERRRIHHPDPEAQKFIDSFQPAVVAPPPPPFPSSELLSIRKEGDKPQPLAGSPAIPAQPGIVLKVDRVVLDKPDTSAILKGSFRLPLLKQDFTPERPLNSDPMIPFTPEYGMPRPAAMLPITLVVLGSSQAAEIVIPLSVPTFDPVDPSAEKNEGTGYFAIDLLRNPNIRGYAQTFSIYAFCGEFAIGPAIMATVTEDMLPQ